MTPTTARHARRRKMEQLPWLNGAQVYEGCWSRGRPFAPFISRWDLLTVASVRRDMISPWPSTFCSFVDLSFRQTSVFRCFGTGAISCGVKVGYGTVRAEVRNPPTVSKARAGRHFWSFFLSFCSVIDSLKRESGSRNAQRRSSRKSSAGRSELPGKFQGSCGC